MLQYARIRRLTIPLTGVILVGLALPWSMATENDDPQALPNLDQVRKAQSSKTSSSTSSKSKGRFQELAKVTEGMESISGLFTLYRYPRGDKTKDPEKLLAKIPASLLNKDLLFASSLSSGGRLTGFMWTDYLVRWQIAGNYLKLMTPDMRYVQSPGATTDDVVQRTYAPRYIAAARILSMTRGGDVLIDLGPLLKSNIADIQFLGGSVRADLSTWSKVKSFPENMLIEANLALSRGQGGTTAGVAYAFRKLPNEGAYRPRAADPRIGYFMTARVDFSKPANERTTTKRYINRWKLQKRDSSLKLSPPKEPIVFIIEDTVPIQWRRWVREGIEMWNAAFEKIGYDRAIVAHQQTKDNAWADIDPEDARYNFIRWIVSGRAFAMGPSRADPRTGQILDSDIIFDDAFVRSLQRQYDLYSPSTAARLYGQGFYEYLQANRDLLPASLVAAMDAEEKTPEDEIWDLARTHMHQQGRCFCAYAEGMQLQVALGQLAIMAEDADDAEGDDDKEKKESKEEKQNKKDLSELFVGQKIRMVIAHEVGHSLGLRHNFKASSWLDFEEIKRRRDTNLPTTASVMDYVPTLFFAGDDLSETKNYATPVLGPYDEWAIEYGYSDVKGGKDGLNKIAARGTERALRYATDEDASSLYSADPFIRRFDLSSDPMAYAESRAKLADGLLENIKEWAIDEGEAKYHMTRAFNILMAERTRNFAFVADMIGGQHFSRAHKGDPNAPTVFTLVDPGQQRAALKALSETVFDSDFFELDPAVLNELANPRWSDWTGRPSLRLDYPVHDRVRMTQLMTLLSISSPPVLQRIYDAELKSSDSDKFTAAELITKTRDMIWNFEVNGAYSDAKPMINSLDRNLQRDHLNIMLLAAQATPGRTMSADIQSMMREALRELYAKIDSVLENGQPDFASRAHLRECHSRIERVLNAQFIAR